MYVHPRDVPVFGTRRRSFFGFVLTRRHLISLFGHVGTPVWGGVWGVLMKISPCPPEKAFIKHSELGTYTGATRFSLQIWKIRVKILEMWLRGGSSSLSILIQTHLDYC
jgi:hypothetical protein